MFADYEFALEATTQGPLYPPSEVMDRDGNFIVVGRINSPGQLGAEAPWGSAVVAPSTAPPLGVNAPYSIVRRIDPSNRADLKSIELYTLPNPIPSNNYGMLFAPDQALTAHHVKRESRPLHSIWTPDLREKDGPISLSPITLERWLQARGVLRVSRDKGSRFEFSLEMEGLIPRSLYTVMSLRRWDLRATDPTRPGPLGIPNAFVTDSQGKGTHWASLPDPFPRTGNRIINIIVLWMSEQRSYGGAIGHYGLGVDVHAQLKLSNNSSFNQIETQR